MILKTDKDHPQSYCYKFRDFAPPSARAKRINSSLPEPTSTQIMPAATTLPATSNQILALPQQEMSQVGLALIRLNNTAINLLQRGLERAAIETFKEALEIQKSTADASRRLAALHAAAQQKAEDPLPAHTASDKFVVLSSQQDAELAYHLLTEKRTSKAFLTLDPTDPSLSLELVRSILVYNFGIAHRCCGDTNSNPNLGSFCVQILQYAETLLPADNQNEHLLFRLVLTRNLMMLSCRLGMSLCEHYKETLDPIVDCILGDSHAKAPGSNDKAPAA